jgi:hypothetical protein
MNEELLYIKNLLDIETTRKNHNAGLMEAADPLRVAKPYNTVSTNDKF